MSIFAIVFIVFAFSQIYWGWRGYSLAARRIRSARLRLAACLAAGAIWVLLYLFTFGVWSDNRQGTPVHLTFRSALLVAPFLWWVSASVVGFLLVALFAIPQAIWALAHRLAKPREIEIAAAAGLSGTYGRGGGRRAFCGRSLRSALRPAQPPDHRAEHPFAAAAACL